MNARMAGLLTALMAATLRKRRRGGRGREKKKGEKGKKCFSHRWLSATAHSKPHNSALQSRATTMAAPTADDVQAWLAQAQFHWSAFLKLMDVSDDEFGAHALRAKTLEQALHVPSEALNRRANATFTLKGLRGIFCEEFSWVLRNSADSTAQLLDGSVLCKYCYKHGARAGIILASAAKLSRHAATTAHKTLADAVAERQVDLVEAGFTPAASVSQTRKRVRELVVGHLVGCGLPYSAVERIFSPNFMAVRCCAASYCCARDASFAVFRHTDFGNCCCACCIARQRSCCRVWRAESAPRR